MNIQFVTGMIVKHPYMGLCLSFHTTDKHGVFTEYVNIKNVEEALKLGSKHVRATVENGRATVLGVDPDADKEEVSV